MIHIPKKISDFIPSQPSSSKSKKVKSNIPSSILPNTPDIPSDKLLKVNEIKSSRNPLKTVVAAIKRLGRSVDNFMRPFNKKNLSDLCEGINQARDQLMEAHKNFLAVSQGSNFHEFIEAGKELKAAGKQYSSIDQKLTKLMDRLTEDEIAVIEAKVSLPDPSSEYKDDLRSIEAAEKTSKQIEAIKENLPPQSVRKPLPEQFIDELETIKLPVADPKTEAERFAVEYQNYLIGIVTAHMEPYTVVLTKALEKYPEEVPAITKAFTEVTDQFVDEQIPKRDEMIEYVTTEVIRRFYEDLDYIPKVSEKSEA